MKFESKKELSKLNKIFKDIPPEKRKLVDGLIHEAAMMGEMLEKLRTHVAENGVSEEYQNGANQCGKKESVEFAAWEKTGKRYLAVITKLLDLLPDEKAADAAADLMGFVNRK